MKKQYIAPVSSMITLEASEMLALSRQSGEVINGDNSSDFEQLSQKEDFSAWGGDDWNE